jgi:hypothetical protein
MNPNSKGTTHDVVEGATEPTDIQILHNGLEHDFSGIDLGIEFNADVEEEIDDIEVEWLDDNTGMARVTGLDSLPAGKYGFRFTLEIGGQIAYSPNGRERDFFQVVGV